jgi:hypothetical protein
MSAQHTPGPWVFETVRTSCGVCHKIGPWPHAWRHGNTMHACIYDDYPSPPEGTDTMRANARLIAAAPDMLEALRGLLEAYSKPDQQLCCNGQDCGCWGASIRDQAEHYAREAVAKAEGRA